MTRKSFEQLTQSVADAIYRPPVDNPKKRRAYCARFYFHRKEAGMIHGKTTDNRDAANLIRDRPLYFREKGAGNVSQ
jgi:hypothetical protein